MDGGSAHSPATTRRGGESWQGEEMALYTVNSSYQGLLFTRTVASRSIEAHNW